MARSRTAHLPRAALTAAALAGAGLGAALLVAACGSGSAAGKVSTALGTRSVSDPTVTATEPGPTVSSTVERTVTAPAVSVTIATTPAATTTEAAASEGTPTWVWVVVAIGGVALIALVVWLVGRGKSRELPLEERRRLVSAAVASWVGQGWAVESQTDDSAVLQREGQRVVVSVDASGRVTSGPLGAPSA
jgi:hypothetical protein